MDLSKSWTWHKAPDLMRRLELAQNSRALWNQDVMTFAGMCESYAELERHVIACEMRAEAGQKEPV